MNFRILDLIATVIEDCEEPCACRPGHSPAATVRVVATLRQFLREEYALARVHALLVAMLRGDPTLILDSCLVRAKRGSDLTGPNQTDRGKKGTKYHLAVTRDGVPVACAATAANVNDTVLFERLFLSAFAVMTRIRTVFADKSYDAESNRTLCRRFGAEPCIHKRRQPSGSGLGQHRWLRQQASLAPRSSAAMPGCWRTSASRCATTASASSFRPCSTPPAYSWLQAGSHAN